MGLFKCHIFCYNVSVYILILKSFHILPIFQLLPKTESPPKQIHVTLQIFFLLNLKLAIEMYDSGFSTKQQMRNEDPQFMEFSQW